MGIIVRQSVSNTIISLVGIVLGFVLTILLFPHILNPDQYGLTRVLISASMISSQFAHLGFQNLVMRYFPYFKNADPQEHGFLFWIITIPITGFLLFCAIYLLAGDLIIQYYSERSPLFVDYYLWVLPLTFSILYFEVLNNYLRSLRDSITGSIVNEVVQRVVTILFLVLFFFGWIDFASFVMLFVSGYLLQPGVVALKIWRMQEWKIRPNLDILRKPLVMGMANYSLFSLLGGLTTVIVWNVDILMISSILGLEMAAIYSIAFYMVTVVTLPHRSIIKIATPLLAEFIKKKQWSDVESIYRKSSLNQIIPGLLIFGLIWIHLDIFYLILPDIYSAGKWVVLIVGVARLMSMATGLNGVILLNSRHYKVSFYTNIVLVVFVIGTNYLLIPIYGIEGAALASAVSLLVFNSIKYFYVLIKMKMQPFTYSTGFVILLGTASIYLADVWVDFGIIWLDILAKTIFFCGLFLIPLLLYNVSPDMNQMLKSLKDKFPI